MPRRGVLCCIKHRRAVDFHFARSRLPVRFPSSSRHPPRSSSSLPFRGFIPVHPLPFTSKITSPAGEDIDPSIGKAGLIDQRHLPASVQTRLLLLARAVWLVPGPGYGYEYTLDFKKKHLGKRKISYVTKQIKHLVGTERYPLIAEREVDRARSSKT